MNRVRLAALLSAHALADGTSLRDALTASGVARNPDIVVAAEAGQIDRALALGRVDADVAALAEAWPPAMRPALARLDALPSPRVVQLQVLESLAYIFMIASAQAVVIVLVSTRVAPLLLELGAAGWASRLSWLGPMPLALLVLDVALVGFGWMTLRSPGRLPLWGRWWRIARGAALAAGLADAEPPSDVRAQLKGRFSEGAVADHEAVLQHALARMAEARERLVSIVRFVGLGGLTLVALALCATTYLSIAEMAL